MEVIIDAPLLKERQGERLRKAAQASGWHEPVSGTFKKPTGHGNLSMFSIPCSKDDGFIAAVLGGVRLPETALLSESALLDGYQDPVFCPEGTTLIAGDLLQLSLIHISEPTRPY